MITAPLRPYPMDVNEDFSFAGMYPFIYIYIYISLVAMQGCSSDTTPTNALNVPATLKDLQKVYASDQLPILQRQISGVKN